MTHCFFFEPNMVNTFDYIHLKTTKKILEKIVNKKKANVRINMTIL